MLPTREQGQTATGDSKAMSTRSREKGQQLQHMGPVSHRQPQRRRSRGGRALPGVRRRVRRDGAATGMAAVGVTERWGSGLQRQLSSVVGRYGRGWREVGVFPIYFLGLLSKHLRNKRTLFCSCTHPSNGNCPLSNFDFQLS